jgi:hypothetical protein
VYSVRVGVFVASVPCYNVNLEKFLQLRDGCTYRMIVMSSTNVDPYYVSSATRDVFNERA